MHQIRTRVTVTPNIPTGPRLTYRAYRILISLTVIGILGEGLLIGPSLFTATKWGREAHALLGAFLCLFVLFLPIAALLARLPKSIIWGSLGLWGLTIFQIVTADLGRKLPILAAFHPADALLLAGWSVLLLLRTAPPKPPTT